MIDRSKRREVRNPLLALEGVQDLLKLPPECQEAMQRALTSIVADARARAQKSWVQNKGPMAAYHKAVGAYAEHLRRVLRAEQKRRSTP